MENTREKCFATKQVNKIQKFLVQVRMVKLHLLQE